MSLNKYYEGAFTLGSGYLSLRGSLEEGLSDDPQDEEYLRVPANVTLEKPRPGKSKWGTFVPGIVGEHFLLNDEIINLPWFLEFQVYCDGERLDLEKSKITRYDRYFNMEDATLTRSLRWQTQSGMEVCHSIFSLYQPEYSGFVGTKGSDTLYQREWKAGDRFGNQREGPYQWIQSLYQGGSGSE